MYLALSFRFLVLEHVSGGELFDHLVKRGRLPLGEVTCLNYFCLSTSFNFYWKCNSAYFGLLYLSVSACDMIGPFCRLYFTVRPTKFKSLFWLPIFLLKKNLKQISGKLCKWENKAKLPNFPVGVLEFFWRRQVANKERWPSTMKATQKVVKYCEKTKYIVERVWRVLQTAGWWKCYGHTCCIVLRFDAHQSSMAILLELKSFPLLF